MNIAQVKQDFDNGVLISRATLGQLIDHAQLSSLVMSRDSYISGGSMSVEGLYSLSGHRLENVKIYISKKTSPDSFTNCYLVCCEITYEVGSVGQLAFNNCIFSDEQPTEKATSLQKIADAAQGLIDVLDSYDGQLVPINRNSATCNNLRNALKISS